MKKTVLNRNYSLLVLVLLILYVTYINIPDNLSMSGGASDNSLEPRLEKHSILYKYLKNYIWVYVVLVALLFGYAIYRIRDDMYFEGIPLLGIKARSNLDWDLQGSIFFPAFFNTAKLKYGLFTPGTVPADPAIAASFEDDADVHINEKNNRLAVDVFCNEIVPCNICQCQGPDPNYAGFSSNAPLIYYPGDKKNQCHPPSVAERFINVVEYLEVSNPPPNPGGSIVIHQKSSGLSEMHVGMIPNCCCELVHLHIVNTPLNNTPSSTAQSREINAENINALTPEFIKASKQAYKQARLMSAAVADNDELVGLGSHAECESATQTIKLGKANDDGTPKVDDSGNPEYEDYKINMSVDGTTNEAIKNQLKSCNGSPEQITKIVKTCKMYNPEMAKGITSFHAQSLSSSYLKNVNSVTTNVTGRNQTAKTSSVNDVPENWTTNPTGSSVSQIQHVPANDWPGTSGGVPDPDNIFGRDIVSSIKTQYWYITGNDSPKPNTKIQLKIITHLYEIHATPLTLLTEISTSQITNQSIINWLDSYVLQGTTYISNGTYTFPPFTKRTVSTPT